VNSKQAIRRKALRYLERGIELDPENSGYLCLLADAYITAGDFDKGINYLSKKQ
jgi:tetratricopeptide (TPR) repeat protein